MTDKIKTTWSQFQVIMENLWSLIAGLCCTIAGAGIVYLGRENLANALATVGVVIGGAVVFVVGCVLLVKLLTKKG